MSSKRMALGRVGREIKEVRKDKQVRRGEGREERERLTRSRQQS